MARQPAAFLLSAGAHPGSSLPRGPAFKTLTKICICEVSNLTEIIQTTQKVLKRADQQTRMITQAPLPQETGLETAACHQVRTNGLLKELLIAEGVFSGNPYTRWLHDMRASVTLFSLLPAPKSLLHIEGRQQRWSYGRGTRSLPERARFGLSSRWHIPAPGAAPADVCRCGCGAARAPLVERARKPRERKRIQPNALL